ETNQVIISPVGDAEAGEVLAGGGLEGRLEERGIIRVAGQLVPQCHVNQSNQRLSGLIYLLGVGLDARTKVQIRRLEFARVILHHPVMRLLDVYAITPQ